MADPGPGRGCPLSYRYGAAALHEPAQLLVDTLWVAGGLYGNRFALERLIELYEREPSPKALVFNGDFHWFDVDAAEFAAIDDAVRGERATLGNIEAELARPQDGAGCGCAYPEWVDDGTVERSNCIIERLRATAQRFPARLERLAQLPMHLVASVGGERVAVVHGDAGSLAGWGFSQEHLATQRGLAQADAACEEARARVFASSHTCLPVLQGLGNGCVVANNGSAGMPNFRGTSFGLVTRISVEPSPRALHGLRAGALHVEALPIDYDAGAWLRRFEALWPVGSPAHCSYHERIAHGPRYTTDRALRAAEPLAA